jgi:acetyl-CoA C-acetyltransferase
MEKLAALRPAFIKEGTVTAGNSSGINDGASALILAGEGAAKKFGLKPLARVVSRAVAGVDPSIMGIGPVPATRKALDRAGLTVSDLGLVELNEAFASQSLACIRDLGLDPSIVNVNGGSIAIGHPLGCSGARISTTLLHEMKKRRVRYGLATMCVGVGQGAAVIYELVDS